MATSPTRARRVSSSRPRRSYRLPLLVITGFAALLLVASLIAVIHNEPPDDSAGAAAPDFSLVNLAGDDVTLADFRGQVVLLNFWASWCPPCKAEMPDLAAYYAQYRDQGFVVVAVNMGEEAQVARAFIEASGFEFPVLLDPTGAVYRRYGSEALPSSYIIGRGGALLKAYPAGMITRAHLDRDVTPLLG